MCYAIGLRTAVGSPLWLAMCLLSTTAACAQDNDDEQSPGLRAEYTAGERTVSRIDGDIAFDWTAGSPDLQLPDGPFRVQWQGQLLLRSEGKYRFHAFLQGKLAVRVNDTVVLAGESDMARWITGEETDLAFGEFPFEVEYASTGSGRILLCWSSDQFPLEPVPHHALFHETAGIPRGPFPKGAADYLQHGCAKCHGEVGGMASASGPSLDHFGVETSSAWLKRQIQNGGGDRSRMPHFGLSDDEAAALTAHLAALSEPVQWTVPELVSLGTPKDITAGQELLATVGCLACHAWQEHRREGLGAGPSLNDAGKHRAPRWLNQWLADPAKLSTSHQMPVFKLSDQERQQIVAALVDATQDQADQAAPAAKVPQELAEQGRKLFQELRCGVCHTTPGPMPRLAPFIHWRDLNLDGEACWREKPDRRRNQPGYGVKQPDVLREFLRSAKHGAKDSSADLRGAQVLIQKGCVNCHDRDGRQGISSLAAHLAAAIPNLQGRGPWLIPPQLTAVGDRLPDERLAKAIRGELPSRRLDWLLVRMPRYQHTDAEHDALMRHLIGHDRIPEQPPATTEYPRNGKQTTETTLAGRELIGGKGFSCVACHPVKDFTPKNVALGTRGTNLFQIGDRLRPEYFFRWTRSPLRVMPGFEMPSYQRPHAVIFPGDLNRQLAAIWMALNDPDLPTPVNPGAVEQYWTVGPNDPPRFLRDVVTLPGKKEITVPRAFAVGFPNGHNILFDLDTASIRAWTVGDFAQQRTQGKSWFWDLVGMPVMVNAEGKSDLLVLSSESKTVLFPSAGAKVRLVSSFMHGKKNGVSFTYELEYKLPAGIKGPQTKIIVQEQWRPEDSGWTRNLIANSTRDGRDGMKGEQYADLYLLEPVANVQSAEIKMSRNIRPLVDSPIDGRRGHPILHSPPRGLGNEHDAFHYSCKTKVINSVPPVLPVTLTAPAEVTVVPGFHGQRLPYPSNIMPTAMTFNHRSQLLFTSLKGHVYRADDLEAKLFAEGLAAPFGILDSHDMVLVAHKPEIVGLVDVDHHGRAVEATVIATGWGLTDDYHDWTCGLVRDAEGNLFTTLGSDYAQKGRPKEKSLWRGHALKIDPAGKIESVARGLRFPTGVAMTSEQHIFITDQQGVQNTFNELNWLSSAKPGLSSSRALPNGGSPANPSLSRASGELRFGVPSLHEPDKDAPATPPAVQIPHQWTRSVNGITAIPKPLADRTHPKLFDQLLGCEYDNRFLVRFSWQMVDGVMQGAVYPFCKPSLPGDSSGFLGPLSIAVSPDGDLYVGSIHDSGWQGGLNTGDIVKLTPQGDWPNGLCEIRATPSGFDLEFFHPVDKSRAEDTSRYQISGYTRVWEGSYATPDSGRHAVEISAAKLSDDGTTVSLTLTGLKPGDVYDVSVGEINAGKDRTLWPHIGHYTLHKVPGGK